MHRHNRKGLPPCGCVRKRPPERRSTRTDAVELRFRFAVPAGFRKAHGQESEGIDFKVARTREGHAWDWIERSLARGRRLECRQNSNQTQRPTLTNNHRSAPRSARNRCRASFPTARLLSSVPDENCLNETSLSEVRDLLQHAIVSRFVPGEPCPRSWRQWQCHKFRMCQKRDRRPQGAAQGGPHRVGSCTHITHIPKAVTLAHAFLALDRSECKPRGSSPKTRLGWKLFINTCRLIAFHLDDVLYAWFHCVSFCI